MALELRPNCELCDRDLPPHSPLARICTFECTFCETCVDSTLKNVCPNCGGGFERRPVRPKRAWRPGLCVATRPPAAKRIHTKYSAAEIEAFSKGVKDVPPEER